MNVLATCYHEDELSMKAVERGWIAEKKRYWKTEYEKLGHIAPVLYLLSRKRADPYPIMSSFVLRDEYTRWCREIGKVNGKRYEPLYPMALSRAFKKLQEIGIVDLELKYKGHYGKELMIKLLFDDPQIIASVGDELGPKGWGELLS